MSLVRLPSPSPLALNPDTVIVVRPHRDGCELVIEGGGLLFSSLTPSAAANRLGHDFRPVRLDDPSMGEVRAYLNRKLVSHVERDLDGERPLCFVSAGGVRYPVAGALDVVMGLLD